MINAASLKDEMERRFAQRRRFGMLIHDGVMLSVTIMFEVSSEAIALQIGQNTAIPSTEPERGRSKAPECD